MRGSPGRKPWAHGLVAGGSVAPRRGGRNCHRRAGDARLAVVQLTLDRLAGIGTVDYGRGAACRTQAGAECCCVMSIAGLEVLLSVEVEGDEVGYVFVGCGACHRPV